jgi:hypothetical protein
MLLGKRPEDLKWTIGGYRVETQMSEPRVDIPRNRFGYQGAEIGK